MPRPSHREKLLEEGTRVVLERGYNGASVRDIVHAAGVPQGSFTNHFRSKEAFAREVLDRYFADVERKIDGTLCDGSLPPLGRLRAWLDAQVGFLEGSGFRTGCLIGNFTLDAGGTSDPIRARLGEIIAIIEQSLAECLGAAVAGGDLPASTDVRSLACFVYSSWQGAIGRAKVERSISPLDRFQEILFGLVLR